jgi:cell division protein FtsN
MLTGRRSAHLRHEFRFGTREVAVFSAALVMICGLAFALGVLVGRELGAGASRGVSVAAGSGGERGRPSRPAVTTSEERLTFYQTLTAPTQELPSVKPPTVEERLVIDEPAPARPPSSPERRATAAVAPPASGRTGPGRSAAVPGVREAAPSPATASPAPAGGVPDGQLWTVQVSSFRSRALAEELRTRLAARGLDAYLVSTSSEEGRVRYRVRVGAFTSRTEAERVAGELRTERSLNPFVTTRTR